MTAIDRLNKINRPMFDKLLQVLSNHTLATILDDLCGREKELGPASYLQLQAFADYIAGELDRRLGGTE